MMTVTYYLLKVVVCSAILFLYYWAVLKNRQFHYYNRFYLLGIALFSWLIPLIKIDWVQPTKTAIPAVYQFVQAIADNHTNFEDIAIGGSSRTFDWNFIVLLVTGIISFTILIRFVRSLEKIYVLINKYPLVKFNGFKLFMTDVEGTPFSFFNYIFWNKSIDVNSRIGMQIFSHEVIHLKGKHSADKVFVELLMIIGWFNPIFWIIKKELYLVHEFIADNRSVENRDSSNLAEILLTAAYPKQQFILRNHFFFSPIKRRIMMLTKNTRNRFSYLRRIFALPILLMVVVLFAFKDVRNNSNSSIHPKLNKKYTIIIDAGHGGKDLGIVTALGDKEKDLDLSISKKIKELNINPNIQIILSRETDEFLPLSARPALEKSTNADLFVSIHINFADNSQMEGLELFIPTEGNKFHNQSLVLANVLNSSVAKVLKSSHGIKTRKEKKIYVLEYAECPSALIECGFISNPSDLEVMKNHQNEIATKVLEGISNYLASIDK